MSEKVRDLRSALKLLSEIPGQLAETDVEVEPMAELSGVYRYVGAGGTVKRPTKEGPAMIFNNIKGHPAPASPSASWQAESGWQSFWTASRKTSGKAVPQCGKPDPAGIKRRRRALPAGRPPRHGSRL